MYYREWGSPQYETNFTNGEQSVRYNASPLRPVDADESHKAFPHGIAGRVAKRLQEPEAIFSAEIANSGIK